MKIAKYQLKAGHELLSYEFISEGPKGLIPMRIQFTLVNRQGVYNLAFGDKNHATGELDDKVISNNGDSEKVLANILMHGFSQRAVQQHGRDFIKWVLLNIMTK